MNVKNLLTAAAMLVMTGTAAAAAESAPAPASTGTTVAVSAGAAAAASPSSAPDARDAARQDAADAVKHYKTPLAIQLEQYRN